MKKIYYLLFLLVALVTGANTAFAQEISPYSVDFNTAITGNTTSGSTWVVSVTQTTEPTKVIVADGWKHIAAPMDYSSSYYYRYTAYQYAATEGVDGSGALRVGNQFTSDTWGDDVYGNDLLVTPYVKGTVTIQAKKVGTASYAPYVEFYQVTGSGDDLAKGAQVSAQASGTLSTTEWVTYTLNLSNYVRLGIKAEYVYIDNFTATSADMTPQPGLSVTAVDPNVAQTVAADADGKFTVTFNATVKNTGETDITAGTENYSLSLYKYVAGGTEMADHDLLTTTAITEDLAKGATTTTPVTLTAELNTETYPAAITNGISFRVYENISGSFLSTKTVTVIPYEPKLEVSTKVGNSTTKYADGQEMYLGMSKEAVEQEVTITNAGGAPLQITAVTAPTGYTTDLTAQTVDALASKTFTITLDASAIGTKEGDFKISSNAGDFTLKLKGTIVDPAKYFVDFESDESVAGMVFEKTASYGWRSKYTNDKGYPSNEYSAYGTLGISAADAGPFKMVTPKLEVAAGDVLVFDASRDYSDGQVKISYSADRQNWTELRTLSSTTENEADLLPNEAAPKYNKVFKQFTIDNIPAGQWYVAFEVFADGDNKGSILIDNIYGYKTVEVAHDVAIVTSKIAEAGQVNSSLAASATVRNVKAEAEAAGSYTARLYFGNEVVKEVEAVELAAPAYGNNGITTDSDVNFDFSFTPHAAGTFQARVELEFADGYKVASAPVEVVIAEEVYAAVQMVGENDKDSRYALIYHNYRNSQTELLYTAEEMAAAGITVGTPITKVVFRGYNTAKDYVSQNGKLWIGETDLTALTTGATTTATGIEDTTPVYEGTITAKKAGTSSAHSDLITIDLPAPYTYQGGNLEVMMYFGCDAYVDNVYVECSRYTNILAVNKYSDSSFSTYNTYQARESNSRPAIFLGVPGEPKKVSGTVTAGEQPVANAVVKAENGEVLYTGTTDAEGKYSVGIMKDDRDYDLNVLVAGYLPWHKTVNVAAGDITEDIALEAAKGITIDEAEVPAEGMVNYAYTATAKVSNYTTTDYAAGSYTAKLYLGDEVVKELEAVELKAGASATFTFTYTPHVAGTFDAYVEFVQGENIAKTETVEVVIAEESAGGSVQVGTKTGTATQAPIYWLWADDAVGGKSDVYYTPEMLADYGIVAGSKITSIKFIGTPSSTKNITTTLVAYVGMQAGAVASGAAIDGLHLVTVNNGEQIAHVANEPLESVIDLSSEPIIYDGTSNIRVYTIVNGSGTYNTVYYDMDNHYTGTSFYGNGSDLPASNVSAGTPVAYFTVEVGETIKGVVMDKNTGKRVAGATIKYQSGDVYYEAESDENGAYTIGVKQNTLSYVRTATGEGYATMVAEVEDVTSGTQFIYLYTPKTISGVVTSDKDNAPVAGATVTLKNDYNEVTATTDAEGKYEITLDVLGIDYAMTVSAADHEDAEIEVASPEKDATVDVVLKSIVVDGIYSLAGDSKPGVRGMKGGLLINADADGIARIYDLSGRLVKEVNVAAGENKVQLNRGVYVVNGMKAAVK